MSQIISRKQTAVFLILAALIAINAISARLICDQTYSNLHTIERTAFTPGVMLGDLAPIIADYLVIKAGHYWHEGRWYLMPVMYSLVLSLQPSYIDYWSLLGWLYAFNNTAYVPDTEKKEELVDKGIALLRKGLLYHPDRYELYRDIAWTYFKKKDDYMRAIAYATKAQQVSHPFDIERLIAMSYYRLGHHEEARIVWTEYIKEHPDSEVARKELERVEGLMGVQQ